MQNYGHKKMIETEDFNLFNENKNSQHNNEEKFRSIRSLM